VTSFELPPGWEEMLRRLRRVQLSPLAEVREALAKARLVDVSPLARERLAAAAEQARRASQAWETGFAASVGPMVEQWRLGRRKTVAAALGPVLEQWRARQAQWGPVLAELARRVAEEWREAMPPNWAELEPGELEAVIERVRVTGFCLVWLPRAEIVRDVLAVDACATGRVLLARREEVLDDAEAELADCSQAELELEREAAGDAIEALRSGRWRPAQALAASVFTSAAHVFFGIGKTRKIRKLMAEAEPMDARLAEVRLETIYLAGTAALAGFRPELARPRHASFNRHNTAHRITREQWTEENALSALMLAVALLRELDFWVRIEHAHEEHPPETH
jgi:hypothetical protein